LFSSGIDHVRMFTSQAFLGNANPYRNSARITCLPLPYRAMQYTTVLGPLAVRSSTQYGPSLGIHAIRISVRRYGGKVSACALLPPSRKARGTRVARCPDPEALAY
jgi:hypothetical protein